MTVPAVVLCADVNTLGIVRSLAEEHVPTIVVDDQRLQPAMHSRHARAVLVPSIEGEHLIDALVTLARDCPDRPVLFLTSDVQVATVSEHRARLAGLYHIRLPDHRVIRDLLHKATFQRLAEQHGFPIPRSVAISRGADLTGLAALQFPVIIKPGLQRYIDERRMARNYKARSREEADALCKYLLPIVDDLVVQEWIEGPESAIYFCLQYRGAAGMVRSFTGRKLRCWPPERGNTASCIAAPDRSTELEALTTAFFDAVGFTGIGSMEFKRDARTGRFLMIEPTVGRTDWQEEIATLNGVNLPLAAYRDALGLRQVPARTESTPVIWRDSLPYFQSLLRTGPSRHAGEEERRARAIHVAWRRDDPWPAIYFLIKWLRKVPKRSGWSATFGKAGGRRGARGLPVATVP